MFLDNYLLIGTARIKNRKKFRDYENDSVFVNCLMQLMEMTYKIYGKKGTSDPGINWRIVVQSLICYGSVVFFRNENGALMALPGVPSGKGWNVYGDPITAWIFSKNGLINKEIPLYIPGGEVNSELDKGNLGIKDAREKKGFMLWDNENRYPLLYYMIYYARAIADTLRTIDVDRIWYKLPSIPVCEDSVVESVVKVLDAMKDNDEIIPVNTGMMEIQKFDLKPTGDVVKNVESAISLIDWYTQQYRAIIGMDANAAIDKKGENLIQDEISINQTYTDTIENGRMEYLNQQCELMNKYLHCDVHFESGIEKPENATNETEDKDDEQDI